MEKEIVELTDEYKIKLKKLQEDYSIILDFQTENKKEKLIKKLKKDFEKKKDSIKNNQF